MIRAIANVVRGEGLASAARRASERVADALRNASLRMGSGPADAGILNVSTAGIAARTGGVEIQLMTRLRAESAMRGVALLHPGGLQYRTHLRRAMTIREALAITGAKAVHFEGTSHLPFADVARLREEGISVVISVHDFSLFSARPNLLEQPRNQFCFYSQDLDRCARCLAADATPNDHASRRALARRLLTDATGVIFPSRFLYDRHRQLFALPDLVAEVVEPAVPRGAEGRGGGTAVAFAGSVKTHKGAHLLEDIARHAQLHVFGGGDGDLLRALRRNRNVTVHGYYRAGALPALLAQHGVGLVLLPSIVPESYSITLSEAWLAGASVAAFDLGAIAERIRSEGGGWVAPLDAGAAGIVDIIERWRSGVLRASVPRVRASASDAARAHVELYRKWRLLI